MGTGKRILIIDFSNYEDFPIGGYLTFARNMMASFGRDLALAGITTSRVDPVGKWFKKKINNVEFDFFAMAKCNSAKTKKIIPDRLVNYLLIKYYRKRILSIGIENIFLQRQESLLALSDCNRNVCYSFAGLDNPLVNSKYSYGSLLSDWFEDKFFKKINVANLILGRGDDKAIQEMILRSNGSLTGQEVIKFPTRINTDVFRPFNKSKARAQLNLPENALIVLTTGRLAWWKGWKFMIDSFMELSNQKNDAIFIMVGEGEDYNKIKSYISGNELTEKVFLTGKRSREEIATYLNASDVYIMGSYKEGWPTALMEAIACGVPACATDFSAVDEIIVDGVNGYIIRDRNETQFAEVILRAACMQRPVKNDHVTRYSMDRLKEDILTHWQLT
ncbi:MAG TPA: glycosyltransferase [Bacteroidales bacterium]|nr:glycosyltransferase [Bacteroidales bacterium]HQG56877.1 glycosyltransferase [Bacteroidales bacterium]HQK69452.1 glycosyltransferase [Bacteroidales bacterium]